MKMGGAMGVALWGVVLPVGSGSKGIIVNSNFTLPTHSRAFVSSCVCVRE